MITIGGLCNVEISTEAKHHTIDDRENGYNP